MTRQEYMNANSTVADTFALHRTYYAQFVTPGLRNRVVDQIGLDKIKASKDPHMNDISLHRWDAMHLWLPGLIREKAKELGEGNSLSTTVCVAKEAARQAAESA